MDEETARKIVECYNECFDRINRIIEISWESPFEGDAELRDQAIRAGWQVFDIGMRPVILKFPHLDPDGRFGQRA